MRPLGRQGDAQGNDGAGLHHREGQRSMKTPDTLGYRVFISYSHEDAELAGMTAAALTAIDLTPMWDKDFKYGHGFHQQIKAYISHAHVFLPIVTEGAAARGWVNQEIGYAMALRIPVLPVTVGTAPGEMMGDLLPVQLPQNWDEDEQTAKRLRKLLSRKVFEDLVSDYQHPSQALFECAELMEERAEMLAQYCNSVTQLGYSGDVRQKGELGSFQIPWQQTHHSVWRERYHPEKRFVFQFEKLWAEREALVTHARATSCRLIVNPRSNYKKYEPPARIVRLKTLSEFLDPKHNADVNVQVAFSREMLGPQNLTIIGDWFSAESVSATGGQGYRHTVFTRHAPTVAIKADRFDQEFEDLLAESGWTAETSRTEAVQEIQEVIADLRKR